MATHGFTPIAGLTLAARIGANTAIFSLLDAGLQRPLPRSIGTNIGMSWPEMDDLRDGSASSPKSPRRGPSTRI